MSSTTFEPKPPVGRPPHWVGPPVRPPVPGHLPTPPAGVTAAGTAGKGYELRGGGAGKHRPIYRVGTTAPGVPPVESPNPQDVLGTVQAVIAAAEQAAKMATAGPPTPTTTTLTIVHEPVA